MSFTRLEIHTVVSQLHRSLVGLQFTDFFEIAPYRWILKLEKKYLLICLATPFLRFHLIKNPPKGYQTSLTRGICSFLVSTKVTDIEGVNKDRILSLHFHKQGGTYQLVGEFFPKHPNLYLLDSRGRIVTSLHPTLQQIYTPPENRKYADPIELSPIIDQTSLEQKYELWEQEFAFQQAFKKIRGGLLLKIKRTQKSKEKFLKDLEQNHRWSEVQHEALLLQSHLYKIQKGMKDVVVSDWNENQQEKRILLDPSLSPKEEVERRFKKSKKMKASLGHLEEAVQKMEESLQVFHGHSKTLEHLKTLEELRIFAKKVGMSLEPSKAPLKKEAPLPYHEFLTETGLKVWVGKSATSNEALTFRYAKGSDYWLHVSDFPGSHVVLRVDKSKKPDSESIQDAIQLAIGYSKAKNQGATEVCLTQCKYVARLGKANPGKVQISKHQKILAKFDAKRFQAIKSRNKSSLLTES